MQKITSFLQIKEVPNKKTSQRAQVISEIYEIYISQAQKNFRKKENWKRYLSWIKGSHIPDSKENQAKFKKSKQFIKEHSVKTICFFMAPIPTADLHYISSMARDMQNRGQNFSGYLMGNLTNTVKDFNSENCV